MSALTPSMTPLERLQHWAQTAGTRVYMTQPQPDGTLVDYTWGQVADEVSRMAGHLRALELPALSRIALLGKNDAHWIMADLAIWMAGHVTVPLYPTLGADTASFILDHSEACLMFVGKLDGKTDNWTELQTVIPAGMPTIGLPMAPPTVTTRWDDLVAARPPLREFTPRDAEALATIIYTSGTTGRPKGVMHSFRSLTAPCRCSVDIWNASSEDRMLSYLPLAHIAERVAVEVPSLLLGFRLYFNDRLETFQADLKRARPTRFFTVPRLWTRFYQGVNQKIPPHQQAKLFAMPEVAARVKREILEGLGLEATRVALTGAAPLPADIIAWYRNLGLDLLEVFGMTENSATSHLCRPGEVRAGYVGTPLPGVACRISDSGEILVKSPGQMLGYYKDPKNTAANLTSDGFFKTGDRGEIDELGRLRVTGRVKELFKTSKGKYIAPAPLENKLGANPRVEAACVTGHGQPQPFALLMLAPSVLNEERRSVESELEQFLEQLNGALEPQERLDYLVLVSDPWTVENGMLTPTLKLRRNLIEERYLVYADTWRESGRRVIWATAP
jgi:long-chain acyl-CoA synthetase